MPANPPSFDVFGVGRAVVDHAVLVDVHPPANSKTEARARWRGAGSPVPVALCQLSRWGWSCGLQAVVGDDPEGELVRREIGGEGVQVESLETRIGARTALASIWVEKQTAKRTVVLDRDLDPLSAKELSSRALQSARCLLIDGWESSAALKAASIARENNVTVVLDAGGVRDGMDQLLKCVDWLIVPVSFVKEYLGKTDLFTAAPVMRSRGPNGRSSGVIITNGAGGCVAACGEEESAVWYRSYPIRPVDTTGAGDVFHAGIVHGLLKGWGPPMSIRWAAAAAALSTTELGARGRLASTDEIAQFLTENGEDGPWQDRSDE